MADKEFDDNYRQDADANSYMKVIPNISKMLEDDDPEHDFPISRKIKSLERYEEGSELGHGAMKQVTLAKDAITDRKVALAKLIEQNDPDLTEQFFLEARLTARLQHPNIIPVYDAGFNDHGEAFFTMKPVGKDTLKTFLASINNAGNNDIQQRLEIFSKICDALAFAHSNGIIHRDLKPENIYLGEFGEVLVGDWGLAKVNGEEDSELDSLYKDKSAALQTLDGYIKGTPGYMAPEQIDKSRGTTDEQSDIYSLGSILYEMIFLRKLHTGTEINELLKSTLQEIDEPDDNIPQSLKSIIFKALSVDKDKRYQSVSEINSDLKKFQSGFITSAEKSSFLKSFVYLLKRHKQVSLLLFLIMCSSVFFTLRIYQEKERAEVQRNEAVNQRQIAEEQRTEAVKQKKLADEAREKREEISKSASPRFTKVAVDDFLNFRFNSALHNVEMAISLNPDNFEALLFKTHFLFVAQKFQEAHALFTAHSKQQFLPKKHQTILSKYIKIKKDDEMLLPVEGIKQFMQDSQQLFTPHKPPRPYVKFIANYSYIRNNYSIQDKLKIAEHCLKITNPRLSDNFKLQYEITENNRLKIDLSNNLQLTSLDALRLLPIEHLDISNTHVKGVGILAATSIKSLSLKGIRVPPQEIRKLRSLKRIYVSTDQYERNVSPKIQIIKDN